MLCMVKQIENLRNRIGVNTSKQWKYIYIYIYIYMYVYVYM